MVLAHQLNHLGVHDQVRGYFDLKHIVASRVFIQRIHFSTRTVTIVQSGQGKGVLAGRLRGVPEGHEDVAGHFSRRQVVEILPRRGIKAMRLQLIRNQKIFPMVSKSD